MWKGRGSFSVSLAVIGDWSLPWAISYVGRRREHAVSKVLREKRDEGMGVVHEI